VDYESLDRKRLQRLADDLRYDSSHKLEERKRAEARMELMKVEAELRNRKGLCGLLRQVNRLLKGG
jgi:hypothetical protein